MWLRLLHYCGLTNLTDQEVERYEEHLARQDRSGRSLALLLQLVFGVLLVQTCLLFVTFRQIAALSQSRESSLDWLAAAVQKGEVKLPAASCGASY